MAYRPILIAGLVSRLLVVVLGCALARTDAVPAVGSSDLARHSVFPLGAAAEALKTGSRRWIEPWYRWDACWYARISLEGYTYDPGAYVNPVAFLPLLPLVMAAGAAAGLDRYWVGLVVPNLAFVAGLGLFARLAYGLTGSAGTAWRACLLLMAYPWSFYFSAPYQESLGFALSAAAVAAWTSGRPWAAAAASAVAPTARLTCLSVPAAVAAGWVADRVRGRPPRPYAWAVAAAGGLGLLAFCAFFWFRFGDFFLHVRDHAHWGRRPPGLSHAVAALVRPPRGASALKDYAATLLFLALGLRAGWKRGAFWGCLALVPVLQPLSTGVVLSMTRIALMAYPAFIEAGELVSNRYLCCAAVVAGAALQVVMLKNYVG